ncbi:maleylacetate reductase [uncultured Aureimonas sp.]|uniref:maleylacetate reductase n=1 Tax=uncultured Aureimonas sp. TaxID=1604662 RepID=UPI0025F80702|nr:maleylacetate reductase [uncultured Aureimonas sp.]
MTPTRAATMRDFVYNAHPARVIFGSGTLARLPEEVERLGLSRVLVVATLEQEADAHRIAGRIGARAAGVFAGARMHTPNDVTARAMNVVTANGIDGLVAVGGGSTTGLAKAIALRTDLPQIVAPTTYAGSEMTPILGETENGRKVTKSDPRILPEVVIYDVDLTLTLPVAMSVTSGMNAIAHAVEALYAREANPIISMMAERAVESLGMALPAIHRHPDDREARSDALFGAWLCGVCLGSVGMALHHKICHTLGGTYNLPHAETHTAVLPHAIAYNAGAAPEAMQALRRALRTDDPAAATFDLAERLGAKMALQSFGLPERAIDDVPDLVLANPYWNPAPLERDTLRTLVADAFAGRRPSAR